MRMVLGGVAAFSVSHTHSHPTPEGHATPTPEHDPLARVRLLQGWNGGFLQDFFAEAGPNGVADLFCIVQMYPTPTLYIGFLAKISFLDKDL